MGMAQWDNDGVEETRGGQNEPVMTAGGRHVLLLLSVTEKGHRS